MYSFTDVSETLFVPMGGRIYASEHFPEIFCDKEALKLKSGLPKELLKAERQSQYTFLAGAIRCKNIDDTIRKFLKEKPRGIVAELGCGLETTYFRTDNGCAQWYELDLPEVIEFREKLIPIQDRMTFIRSSAFDRTWIDDLSKAADSRPVLIVASGFFHYFEESSVIELMQNLRRMPDVRIVFDAVSSLGMKGTRRHMKKLGRSAAEMYFCCDNASLLAAKIADGVSVISERDFYRCVDKAGMNFTTRLFMKVSDLFHMVKIIEFRLS